MPIIYRGQVTGPNDINGYITRSDGLPADPFFIESEVHDISTPANLATPVSVIGPLTPNNFGVGAYWVPWTVALNQAIGLHRVTWRWQLVPSAPMRTAYEEFKVEDSSNFNTGEYALYVTAADMYAEGLRQDAYPLSLVENRLRFTQQYIERITGFFFAPRQMEFNLDGSGNYLLKLPQPIISIPDDGIAFVQDSYGNYQTQDKSNFAIYNRFEPDDRRYPRIKVKSNSTFSIFGGLSSGCGIFPPGTMNIRVIGTFGYTEPPNFTTPEPIRFIMMVLTKILLLPATSPLLQGAMKAAQVNWQITDGHQFRISDAMAAAKLTGVPFIDNILIYYTRGSGASADST